MAQVQRIAVCSCAGILLFAGALTGKGTLGMQVSPVVAPAPATVTVRVTFQPAAEDRRLQVIAESPTFYRSSEIELDGARSSPVQVFEFRNLPAGVYQITGVLLGAREPRATVVRLAHVTPSVGSR